MDNLATPSFPLIRCRPMKFLKPFSFQFLFLFLWTSSAMGDFGNRFVADQGLAVVLNSPALKISFRFTCQDDMSLTAASVYCLDALAPPAYLVSLQGDMNGFPSGISLASSRYTPRAKSWSTIPLGSALMLKGKVYHLVVESDLLGGGHHPVAVVDSIHFASLLSTDILNHLHPIDQSPDPAANTLLFEKEKWRTLDQEPVYAVYGTGSHFQGNPYDDPKVLPIFGKTLQGQVLHFHCGYPAKALAFRLRKVGNPTAPLKYQILAHNYKSHVCRVLTSGTFLGPEQSPSLFKWVTFGGLIPEASTFPAECYYFVLQTDSGHESKAKGACENCYELSSVGHSGGLAQGSDLTFDGGAHNSRATCSMDGGNPAHWIDDFERDANIVAIGPVCPVSESRAFDPLPTPVPLPNEPRYTP